MLNKRSEKGQAIIMIVFAIIGLVGLTGLTVDGGRAFSDRRHAQGAADSAAWAAGLANARGETIDSAAYDIADQNGYINDDGDFDADASDATRSDVYVEVTDLPIAPALLANGDPNPCPVGVFPNKEIRVTITSFVQTFFAPVLGVEQVTNNVEAVARACGTYVAPIFGGNAIVSCGNGISASECSYNSGNSGTVDWTINGAGIYAGTCAFKSNNSTVTLTTSGKCVSAVNGVSGFPTASICPGPAAVPQCTNDYLNSIMPFNVCALDDNGDPVYADKTELPAGVDVINLVHLSLDDLNDMSTKEFTDGVFCLDDLANSSGQNPLKSEDIILQNATLYITDEDFDLGFDGGGGFEGTPTISGTFARYAVIVARASHYCQNFNDNEAQVVNYRGNAVGSVLYGTVLAPTACIDMRGNAGTAINSQIIANKVGSNGNATIVVTYNEGQNRLQPIYPIILLVK